MPPEPREEARSGTRSVKWSSAAQYFSGPSDLVPFHIADMDFAVAQPVSTALRTRVAHPVYGYSAAAPAAVRAVTAWYLRRHSVAVPDDWVIMLPFGARPALGLVIRTLATPGSAVATLAPSYPGIRKTIQGARCRAVEVALQKSDRGYVIDWAALASALRQESTGALVLCSPHNPTGRVWSGAEIARVKHLCAEAGVCLISDEVHSDIVYRGSRHVPVIAAGEDQFPVVLIHAPGKGFNVSGIPASFAIVPDGTARAALLAELAACSFHQGGLLSDLVHEACFGESEQWLDATVAYLEGTRDAAVRRLEAAPDAPSCQRPEGTFLLWLDFSAAGLTAPQLEQLLVTQARVGLLAGQKFGLGGDGYFRLNIATGRDRVLGALDRIVECLGSAGVTTGPTSLRRR